MISLESKNNTLRTLYSNRGNYDNAVTEFYRWYHASHWPTTALISYSHVNMGEISAIKNHSYDIIRELNK